MGMNGLRVGYVIRKTCGLRMRCAVRRQRGEIWPHVHAYHGKLYGPIGKSTAPPPSTDANHTIQEKEKKRKNLKSLI